MKIKSKVRGGPRGCGGGIGLPTTDVQIPLGGAWRRGRLRGVSHHATWAAAPAARDVRSNVVRTKRSARRAARPALRGGRSRGRRAAAS